MSWLDLANVSHATNTAFAAPEEEELAPQLSGGAGPWSQARRLAPGPGRGHKGLYGGLYGAGRGAPRRRSFLSDYARRRRAEDTAPKGPRRPPTRTTPVAKAIGLKGEDASRTEQLLGSSLRATNLISKSAEAAATQVAPQAAATGAEVAATQVAATEAAATGAVAATDAVGVGVTAGEGAGGAVSASAAWWLAALMSAYGGLDKGAKMAQAEKKKAKMEGKSESDQDGPKWAGWLKGLNRSDPGAPARDAWGEIDLMEKHIDSAMKNVDDEETYALAAKFAGLF